MASVCTPPPLSRQAALDVCRQPLQLRQQDAALCGLRDPEVPVAFDEVGEVRLPRNRERGRLGLARKLVYRLLV
jgi:hypothetical protein